VAERPQNAGAPRNAKELARDAPSMSGRGRLVIVCGLPGAGKTTVAKALVRDGGLRLCPDEWMGHLGFDLFDNAARGRVEQLQWILAKDLLRAGQLVVLEWGLWTRRERDEVRVGARRCGATVELHYLDVPLEERWRRVQQRNDLVLSGSVELTYENLVEYDAMFEAPTSDELALYDDAP
jgi:predicted kinase